MSVSGYSQGGKKMAQNFILEFDVVFITLPYLVDFT